MITLKDGVGYRPTVADITGNPKRLKIVEIDAAQTARSTPRRRRRGHQHELRVEAKIEPTSAILREDPKGPYVNLIAVREQDKDKPWVKTLADAYRSPEVRNSS